MSLIAQMKLLIRLAQSDGEVVEAEKKFILSIAAANRLDEGDVLALIAGDHALAVPGNLSEEEKFNYLVSLVQLMKIDERLYQEELHFCARVAARLGYHEHVMYDFLTQVKSAHMHADDLNALRELASKYLGQVRDD